MDQFMVDALAAQGYRYDEAIGSLVPLNADADYYLQYAARNAVITPDEYFATAQTSPTVQTAYAIATGEIAPVTVEPESIAPSVVTPIRLVTPVPQPEPVAEPQTYTDAQIVGAVRESLDQGVSWSDIANKAVTMGIALDTLTEVIQAQDPALFARLFPHAVTDGIESNYSDDQIVNAVEDSLDQGFSWTDILNGAQRLGVDSAILISILQARAPALYARAVNAGTIAPVTRPDSLPPITLGPPAQSASGGLLKLLALAAGAYSFLK